MKTSKPLLILLLIAIVCGSILAYQRWRVESDYNHYEIIADYDDFENVASYAGEDYPSYLTRMKDAGIHSITVNEETIDQLKLDGNYNIKSSLEGDDLIVEGDASVLAFVEQGLKDSLKEDRAISYPEPNKLKIDGKEIDLVRYTTGGADAVGTTGGAKRTDAGSKLEFIGLGFDQKKIDDIKQAGLSVVFRPVYDADYQDPTKTIQRFFRYIDANAPEQKYVIFKGTEALGNSDVKDTERDGLSDGEQLFVDQLQQRNMSFALIEAGDERGNLEVDAQEAMLEDNEYEAVRVFSTWDYIQRRYDYEIPGHREGREIGNAYFRAITERNIRVILLKPFIDGEKFITDMSKYKTVLGDLQSRLAQYDIVPDDVKVMPYWKSNQLLKAPIVLAVVAATLVLLNLFIALPRKWNIGLFAAGSVVGVLPFLLNIGTSLMNNAVALVAIIVFPSLAMAFVMRRLEDAWHNGKLSFWPALLRGFVVLLLAIAITLIGALFEVALLSGSEYLLELLYFRGVKISQILPMGLTALLYLSFFGFRRAKQNKEILGIRPDEMKELLFLRIEVWQILVVGVLAVIAFIFLARSGNSTIVGVSDAELLFRNFLENVLPARPRTKAIFIAYPATVLLFYLAYRKRFSWTYFFLLIASSIGFANIVNTFSHLRTPLRISMLRVLMEIVTAIPTALLFAGLGALLIHLVDRYHPQNSRLSENRIQDESQ